MARSKRAGRRPAPSASTRAAAAQAERPRRRPRLWPVVLSGALLALWAGFLIAMVVMQKYQR